MQEKSILLRFLAVPLGHKLLAAGVAVAIGSGLFVLSRQAATRPVMPAVLSFDESAAEQAAPEITHAKEPAVVLAQSILTDEALSGLANPPILSVVGKRSDPVEFRSHLLITQSSPKSLQLSYRDPNREYSTATANAVANLLVAWRPSSPISPAPVQEAVAPVTSVPAPTESHLHKVVESPSTNPLPQLEAQLSAIDKKLAALAAESKATAGGSNADAAPKTMSAEMVQQHLLETQVAAAQKKLDDLRLRYTDEYPDVEKAKENLAESQQELDAAKRLAANAQKVAGPVAQSAPAADASQLRTERGLLTTAIAAEKRRQAMQRQLTALQAEEPGALLRTASPSPPKPAPVQATHESAGAPIFRNPFTLERPAGSAGGSPPESGSMLGDALAGVLCGLLYLGGAMWRYRYVENAPAAKVPGLSTRSSEAEANMHAEASGNAGASGAAETSGHAEILGLTDASAYVGTTWEEDVRRVIAQTDLGRQEEPFLARNCLAADKQSESKAGLQGLLHYNEVSEAIREKIKREPNSWMAHTEEARLALATGDVDMAIKKIELAMTVAPEAMKPKLDKIVIQLGRNLKVTSM